MIMTEETVKTSKTFANRLLNRGIKLEATNDTRLGFLQNTIKAEIKPQPVEKIDQIFESLKSSLIQTFDHSDKQSFLFLDSLVMHIDKNKNEIRYPFAHSVYFGTQLQRCGTDTEHILQRTIMMNIFHPYWLPEMFDWNAEGQWLDDPNNAISSSLDKDEKLTRPRPDLSFAFARTAFDHNSKNTIAGEEPEDLRIAISPDGRNRAFPFFFVEAKQGSVGLKQAGYKNLNNAARALYNIYRWFEKAKTINPTPENITELNKSFHKIRVFTFAFNASYLVVRVHRALVMKSGKIKFDFALFFETRAYTRDQVCGLFNNIIHDYAAKELFAALLGVYEAVTAQEESEDEPVEGAMDSLEENSSTSQEHAQFSQDPQMIQPTQGTEDYRRSPGSQYKRKQNAVGTNSEPKGRKRHKGSARDG